MEVGRDWKSLEVHIRRSLDYLKEIIGRNRDIKDVSGEVSDGNEEHVTEYWRKGNPCYKVAENWATLYSKILWKVVPVMINLDI